MIKEITVTTDVFKRSFSRFELLELELSLTSLCSEASLNASITFEVEFNDKIQSARTSAYQWTEDFQYYIAGPLSPKIIKLRNGQLIQANCNLGFWEINSQKDTLFWKLNPSLSRLIVNYKGDAKKMNLEEHQQVIKNEIKLLFPKQLALEWSRSKIPFSAVACFMDHCDFDTLENLRTLRELFHQTGVRTTKGFFLNHFSKRTNNASWEKNGEELSKWIDDGHELAYHSLSQSLKPDEENFKDFENFTAPLANISTWIDHGFQPYNLSLWSRYDRLKDDFFEKMNSQSVSVFWNCLDSGTSTEGVLNQLSLKQFTLESYFKGISGFSRSDKLKLGVKNVLFHYYADEKLIKNYKVLASKFKRKLKKKNIQTFLDLSKSLFNVFLPLFRVVLFWNKEKKRIYPLAKYNPIFFTLEVGKSKFTFFQTVEMNNFIVAISKENLDSLVNECGFFIAHTYFSVNLNYHNGKILLNDSEINTDVLKNFQYLGDFIKKGKVWNPTLIELSTYLKDSENLEYFINGDGNIFVKNKQYHFREVI